MCKGSGGGGGGGVNNTGPKAQIDFLTVHRYTGTVSEKIIRCTDVKFVNYRYNYFCNIIWAGGRSGASFHDEWKLGF